jgi:MFS family permease
VKHESDENDWFALKILLSGMLGMVVAMGIGRFAFTPILPLMQRDLGMINSVAGWLAGLNYLGYLAGAVAVHLHRDYCAGRRLWAAPGR